MSTTRTQSIVISSKWFNDAFTRGLQGKSIELTEENFVNMVRSTVQGL